VFLAEKPGDKKIAPTESERQTANVTHQMGQLKGRGFSAMANLTPYPAHR